MNYKYVGPTYKNCGPSGAQQQALKSAQGFESVMENSYKTVFGLGSKIFNSLKAGFDKIINTTHGMSPEELAARRSEISANAAAANQKVQRQIGERAAMTGAVPGVESGIVQAERAQAATDIAMKESAAQENVTAEDYSTGRKERDIAMEGEAGLPGKAFAPAEGFAGTTVAAQKNVEDQAQANEQASSSWMGLVGGLADAAVGGLMPKIKK